ncbi:hypothetical protein AB0451_07895 [Streptomyces sp. NPDC052000]
MDIILAHATALAEEDNITEAQTWRDKAAHHAAPPIPPIPPIPHP